MPSVEKHFDDIAVSYDGFKRKNWYYYSSLKTLARRFVPENSRVLEVGTATGDILASLKPADGTGLDISGAMVAAARQKYAGRPELKFFKASPEDFRADKPFDFLVMVDVVEHMEHPEKAVAGMAALAAPGTLVFVSMANPLWEPALLLLEKLGLKMPEGAHYRMSFKKLNAIFTSANFRLEKRGFQLLLPAHVPFVSALLNAVSEKIPFLNRLCLIEYMLFIRTGQ